MQDFSLIERIKILSSIVVSSKFFLMFSIFVIISLMLLLITYILDKKLNKIVYISIWMIFLLIILIFYHDVLLNIVDNLFDNMFMIIYFPSISFYFIILVVSNFFLLYSVFNKKIKKVYKTLNILNALLINSILLFVVSIINKNNINVYDKLSVYSNSNLLVLIEFTTAFFIIWLILNFSFTTYFELKKKDKKPLPQMEEIIIFDEN